jgi:hypothetical protein
VFFQDATSYQKKVDVIMQKHPAIGGFAHWRGGNEDPATWDVIRGLADGGSGTSTIPPVDFLINGASVMTVTAGSNASTNYGLVAINGFTADTSVTAVAGNFPGTATVNRTTIRPGVTTTLTVAARSKAASGTYAVKLRFVSGSLVHEQVVNVTVVAAPKRPRPASH